MCIANYLFLYDQNYYIPVRLESDMSIASTNEQGVENRALWR